MAHQFKLEEDYFEKHRRALVRLYNGRWVVVKDDHVLGSFKRKREAREFVSSQYGSKSCFIRKVAPRITRPDILYYSRFILN